MSELGPRLRRLERLARETGSHFSVTFLPGAAYSPSSFYEVEITGPGSRQTLFGKGRAPSLEEALTECEQMLLQHMSDAEHVLQLAARHLKEPPRE